MKFHTQLISGHSLHAQKGIATILIVVLVGIALTATSLGIIHSVRSTQEKLVSVHAATNAQNSLWAGVEAFRRYLAEADDASLTAISNGNSFAINMGSNYGSLSVENIAVTTVSGVKRVSAKIVSRLDAARASTAASVVFEIPAAGNSDTVTIPSSLNFYDDLELQGALSFKGPSATDKLNVNVDGAINVHNVNLSAIGTLASTKSVSLDGGLAAINLVHSNGNVTTNGNTGVIGEIQAMGNVTITGGSTVTHVKANGFISSTTGGYAATLNALGNISTGTGGGTQGVATAGGSITWMGGTFSALNAVGNITISTAKQSPSGVIKGKGNINCTDSSKNFGSIEMRLAATNCGGSTSVTQKDNTITLMTPVTSVVMNPFTVDVYKLQGHANWVFSYDTANNRMLVRTQNVNGLTDGTYMIGSKDVYYPVYSSAKSHLCQLPASGNTCANLITPATPICLGAPNSECISYNTSTKKWALNGVSAAPGIMWFEGNVKMDNGTSFTTVLVSGNIDTGGQFVGYAVNYAGFAKVCQASPPAHLSATDKTRYTTAFTGRYPKNLCDLTTSKMLPVTAGNIALAAGGFKPPSTTYAGGTIELSSTNTVYGSVLAGNAFQTLNSNTNVNGYIVAANMATVDPKSNTIKGAINVDLSTLPSTYDPTKVPNMSDNTGGGNSGGSAQTPKVLWAKYL